MSPELITAIKERISAGQEKSAVEADVIAMGHTKEIFEAAYTLAQHDVAAAEEGEILPSARALFVSGWQFTLKQWWLVLLLLVPLSFEVLIATVTEYEKFEEIIPSTPVLVALLVTGLLYMGTFGIALYTTTRATGAGAYKEALAWTGRNIIPLLCVYVLSGLVIFGGFVFFVIPGIAAMVALTFAQYVFAHEHARGFKALVRSRALVSGRFWRVTRKILAFILLTLIPILFVGIVSEIIVVLAGEGKVADLAGEFIMVVVSAVMTVINLHAMNSLYLTLAKRDVEGKEKGTVWYSFLAGLAVVTLIALGVAAYYFKDSLATLSELPLPTESGELETSIVDMTVIAQTYKDARGGSFAGVCAELTAALEGGEEVVCNDSGEAWAIAASDTSGTQWCADTETESKRITAPLEARTTCLALPE